jgi:glycosyltransferase 2 family protein
MGSLLSLWAGPPAAIGADIGSSFDAFFRAARAFFHHLADIGWVAFVLALIFYLGMLLTRTRAWQNVLRAAYPRSRVSYKGITAAYLVGAGINGIIPARVGDAVKIFLAKRVVPHSSYPAITSSFFVQSVFDTVVGVLVFSYALTQGLLPKAPRLPKLNAFEIAFWAQHPQLLIFFLTALGVGLTVLFIVLAQKAELFWDRVKQGVVILRDLDRYFREVVSWQSLSWVMRFASFWFFLEAFHIGGSVQNVLLVMSVQAVSTMLPFTPGGAGAQQALLVATLKAGHSRTAVLSYSVGQQIAIAAWAALLGFLALIGVFRTTDVRGLMRDAEDAAGGDESGKDGGATRGTGREPANAREAPR